MITPLFEDIDAMKKYEALRKKKGLNKLLQASNKEDNTLVSKSAAKPSTGSTGVTARYKGCPRLARAIAAQHNM